MARRIGSIRIALLAGSMLAATPVLAADVTPERLLNPDKEPQNWLMNHRTYDGQRFSPLARINRDNVKNLKLAYAVPLGGGAGNEFANATPLAEDGFLYVTDSWSVLYKIDVRSGDLGRIVWRMDPKQDRQMRSRGAALWGNLVITGAGGFGNSPRIIATDKDTGKVIWETSFSDTPDVTFTAAPLAIKDKIIVGAANGDQGVRDWIAGLDAATGKRLWLKNSGPWRTWQRNLERQHQCLAHRRRRGVGNGHLRSRHQPDPLGNRQSGTDVRSVLSAGRQPLHQQCDLLESRHWQHELVFSIHAGRHVGLRRGWHPYPDRRTGRRAIAQADYAFGAKRLFLHHGARQWRDGACQALYGGQLDQRHRPEDRQAARVRSR
jgi:outer membrane protein assembly factor BamB